MTTPDQQQPKPDPVRELLTQPARRRSLSDLLEPHRRDEPDDDEQP